MLAPILLAAVSLGAEPLAPGDHLRQVTVKGLHRSYLLHVPPPCGPPSATPVVLVFHGAGANGTLMAMITNMNKKADEAGFVAVYPNGTGLGPFLTFNAGGRRGPLAQRAADDVAFVACLLDDLASVHAVDTQRIYATGISNGGMMCYRLAAELSDRIAAIAPVAGTMAIDEAHPTRPVPIIHFHGTADRIVPPAGPNRGTPKFLTFKPLAETLRIWRDINGCPEVAQISDLPDLADDDTTVRRITYGPGTQGAEVVYVEIQGGGHSWPGREAILGVLGKTTQDISANDMMWEFFERHPLPW